MWKYGLILLVCFLVYYYVCMRRLYASNRIIRGNTHLATNKLMIVAHPDDELIFGGSLLLSKKGWCVICVTGGSLQSRNKCTLRPEENRVAEFINVMNDLECGYEIWDFEDNLFNANWNTIIEQHLRRVLNRGYKRIVTHNLEGEYGHVQHKKLSQLIHQLHPPHLYVFHFTPIPRYPTTAYLTPLIKVLTHYKSQKAIVQKYNRYILHQNITPAYVE